MYFPIRCFTCGSVIGQHYEDYAKQIKEGKNPAKILNSMDIDRYCCRRMFLSHVEVMDKIVKYRKY
ncbi:TPA: DNA-directed RNA polymerase subunit N [Candidatus Micrarchaeota archaeon]|nr:DNA-directed RNA polymerase subunit N [Candidatus Micrarchaeota archaeon]HIH30756.1 DNA-directed RNA polymerase subunit N [Candidatus Micrarchaeota archaeon]